MSQVKLQVPPSEWRIIKPLLDIASFERSKIKDIEGRISKHKIAKIFKVMEDFVSGKELESTAHAEVIGILADEFGFSNNEEKEKINVAVANLLDELARIKRRDPVRAWYLVRAFRKLIVEVVLGNITVEYAMFESIGKEGVE
jgi:F0F1-type ATP synthase alpha subunit